MVNSDFRPPTKLGNLSTDFGETWNLELSHVYEVGPTDEPIDFGG